MSKQSSMSKALLRSQGYEVDFTEQPWNKFSKVRKDLFGFCDLLAMNATEIIAVQSTSTKGGNVQQRLEKIRKNTCALLWMRGANRKLHVHGWRTVKEGRKSLTFCDVSKLRIIPGGSMILISRETVGPWKPAKK